MSRWLRVVLFVVGLSVILFAVANLVIRDQAVDFAHNTIEEQEERIAREYEGGAIIDSANPIRVIRYGELEDLKEVPVVSDSGMSLNGYYRPSENGAAVMLLHGVTAFPNHMMEEAMMLSRHGYGVLLITVRNHNFSDGETISFGCEDREMEDLRAWHQFLSQQEGVDPERIGLLGQSMGATLSIQYAAQTEEVKAVVAVSSPSSLKYAMPYFISAKTGLPLGIAKLVTGPMLFWYSREVDCDMSTVNAQEWVGDISPRAVYILHGEEDPQLPPDSGALLYEAAGEPKYY